MWNKLTTYSLLIISFISVASCKSKKPLLKDLEAAEIQAKTKANEIIRKVHENKFDFENLSALIKTKYETSKGESQSFKTFLKIRKDSAIWTAVTYLNIPIMQALITPDSVKIMNQRDKKYFIGTIDYVSTQFKVPINYSHIQNLLVGNPISLDTTEDHYFVNVDDDIYISSVKPTELESILKGDKIFFGWIYRYWINELYRPGKTVLHNPGQGNSLEIFQEDFNKEHGMPFPNKTKAVFVSQKDTIDIRLNYNKVKLNKDFEIKFNIPDKYEPYETND